MYKDCEVAAVRDWAKNKANLVIACGICPALSYMNKDVWHQERPDTNSNEQTGWKNQSLGKALDFASAVEMYVFLSVQTSVRLLLNSGQEADTRDINQWTGRTKYGTWTYQKDNSIQARQGRMLARSRTLDRVLCEQTYVLIYV